MSVRSEDYLALLYRLGELGISARLNLIARELRVSAPSALRELSRLERKGLIAKRKPVYLLTEKGRSVAEGVVRKHRVLERFLTDVLSADPYKAHVLAHELEHAREFAEIADAHIGKPSFCPHGNPVPGRASLRAIPLVDAGVGEHRLLKIGELESSLEWARRLNLHPGRPIVVKEVGADSVTVEWLSRRYKLPFGVARVLYVEKR